jgi:LysM repeat protein
MFAHSFTASLFFLPLVAQFTTVIATACIRNYTVQAGDSCDAISASHNVSTFQLAAINPAIDTSCSNLMPGQNLCLGTAGEDCTTTYVVQPDDTCDGIQENVGVNSTIFLLNNPQIDNDCYNIYVGEVLCTAQTVLVPPSGPASPPASSSSAPATTVATITPTSAAPTASAAPTDPSGDDDDLPYCDEL